MSRSQIAQQPGWVIGANWAAVAGALHVRRGVSSRWASKRAIRAWEGQQYAAWQAQQHGAGRAGQSGQRPPPGTGWR
ncbi:hypothetical protein [Leekyejoonella antrihumi]|uniref:Uncharacterized protein n=1 Tax=Leekyejoonella antrihumi TaxID=1660198 RepID=A0A563DTD7_9MICO|nr:hypothetical protein [Leekyejoonella antrihumi]TWP33518.1 hypothetical protein FGL98_20930 [Leekyejoonella antrihumi]